MKPNLPTVDELIGPARRICLSLIDKVNRAKQNPNQVLPPFLIWGPPGTGKSTLAKIVAYSAASHPTEVQCYNGKDLGTDLIRQWRNDCCYIPLMGVFSVKLVDEIDSASKDALGNMRTFLDNLTPNRIFIATTNRSPQQLDESVQSRFYDRECPGATPAEIASALEARGMDLVSARQVAEIVDGNVRQAWIELDKYNDAKAELEYERA